MFGVSPIHPQMSNPTPNLIRLLSSSDKSLIDKFSICAALTQDLYKVKYQVPQRERKAAKKRHVPDTRDAGIPSSSSSSKRPARTLKDLQDESDVDDGTALEGFLDEKSGEKVYLIEKVIKYEPKYGYFVHWQGYPKSERSWQLPDDMPPAFAKEMAQARNQYRESRKSALNRPDDI